VSQVATRVGKERLSGERAKTNRSAGQCRECVPWPPVPAAIVPRNRELDLAHADALEEGKRASHSTHDNRDGKARDLFPQSSQHRAQIDQIAQAEGVMDYNARRQSTRCAVTELRYGNLFLEYQVALFVVIAWLRFRLSKIDAA